MAKYRPVYTKIWKDPDFEEYSPQAKLIFIYLCTNESTTESGIYPISLKTIANETGNGLQTVKKLLGNGCIKNISYDFEHQIVFVENFRKYNGGGKPSLIVKAIENDVKAMPDTPLWARFIEIYPEFKEENPNGWQTVSKRFANGCSGIRANPNPNPNPKVKVNPKERKKEKVQENL